MMHGFLFVFVLLVIVSEVFNLQPLIMCVTFHVCFW